MKILIHLTYNPLSMRLIGYMYRMFTKTVVIGYPDCHRGIKWLQWSFVNFRYFLICPWHTSSTIWFCKIKVKIETCYVCLDCLCVFPLYPIFASQGFRSRSPLSWREKGPWAKPLASKYVYTLSPKNWSQLTSKNCAKNNNNMKKISSLKKCEGYLNF